MPLPEPIDGKTKVLKKLLEQPFVSFKDFPPGFAIRSRISDLRLKYYIDIFAEDVEFTNEFGKRSDYVKYSLVCLTAADKEKIIKKYKSFVEKPKNPVAAKEPEPELTGSA